LRGRSVDRRIIIVLGVLMLLVFPFFKWSTDGPAFRFALIFILMCPILLIWITERLQNSYLTCAFCVVLVSLGFLSYTSYQPVKHDPPYQLYRNLCKRISVKNDSADMSLIIAHKSLAEFVVYTTGIDAMSWIPEYKVAPERLWRLAADVKDVEFRFYLTSEELKFVTRMSPSYAFVREDVWNRFLDNVKADGNEELLTEISTWRNPDEVRPYFLLKNKR
jgi:hypothetical protein